MPFGQPVSEKVWWEVAKHIGASSPDGLLSIKIRALDDVDQGSQQFFYEDDYTSIFDYLRQFKEERRGDFSDDGGKAFLYQLPDGTKFLFGQHETGPELVIFFSDFVNHILRSAADDASIATIFM